VFSDSEETNKQTSERSPLRSRKCNAVRALLLLCACAAALQNVGDVFRFLKNGKDTRQFAGDLSRSLAPYTRFSVFRNGSFLDGENSVKRAGVLEAEVEEERGGGEAFSEPSSPAAEWRSGVVVVRRRRAVRERRHLGSLNATKGRTIRTQAARNRHAANANVTVGVN